MEGTENSLIHSDDNDFNVDERFSEFRKILNTNTSIVDSKENDVPAICIAVKNGSLQAINLLIEKGVDLEAVDDKGNTALIYAIKCKNIF